MQKSPIPGLSDRHYHELSVGSGITDQQIIARGYRTTDGSDIPHFAKAQQLPGIAIPIRTVDNKICYERLKPLKPRDKEGKPLKYEQPARQAMRLDIPAAAITHLKNPRIPLWITEGEKKVDSFTCRAVDCIIIGVLGVWNWRGKNDLGGLTELADWEAIALEGRDVFIAFDGDVTRKESVRKSLRRMAAFLKRRGARVHVVLIPEPHKGLDDYLVAGGTPSELAKCLDNSLLEDDRRPGIELHDEQARDTLARAIVALVQRNDPPEIFIKEGSLVEVVDDEHDQAWIRPIKPAGMQARLASAANWFSRGTATGPQRQLAEQILELPRISSIPAIEGISACPILSDGGSFVSEQGYDPDSRWFITSGSSWEPFTGDAPKAARWLLSEIFGEFPFEDSASVANTLALLLTPFIRPRIKGMVPMFFADAPRSRTGKGLILDAALMPAIGKRLAAIPLPVKEEELNKTLFSLVRQARQVVFFDNIKGRVSSGSFESCLTSGTFSSRILGTNDAPDIPVKSIFVMTANNGELSTDMAGRCMWIRLNAQTENPETRTFKKARLRSWILSNRHQIIGAAIRIVMAWVDAKKPIGDYVKGGYEEWSEAISGILDVARIEGLGSNDIRLKEASASDDLESKACISLWWGAKIDDPVTAKDLVSIEGMADAVPSAFGAKNTAMAFGRFLASLKGRVVEIDDILGQKVVVGVYCLGQQKGVVRFKLQDQKDIRSPSPTGTALEKTSYSHISGNIVGGLPERTSNVLHENDSVVLD